MATARMGLPDAARKRTCGMAGSAAFFALLLAASPGAQASAVADDGQDGMPGDRHVASAPSSLAILAASASSKFSRKRRPCVFSAG